MANQALRDFLLLFATVDPIGTLAIFLSLTSKRTRAERWRIGLLGVLIAGLVLVAFLVIGEIVLSGMGVRLPSFQLSGGIILFLFSLQMVFGDLSTHGGAGEVAGDVTVFPLALPTIASPGAILAVVLLTENHTHSVGQQAMTAAMLALVLLIVLGVFWLAEPIHRTIGTTGENVLVRVMGLLLAALAAEEVVQAIFAIIRDRH